MKCFIPLLLVLFSSHSFGQSLDSIVSLSTDTVRFFEDSRINKLVGQSGTTGYTIKTKGYRIQIYNGGNRQKAQLVQLGFKKQYPEVPAYIFYSRPHFRVRVGNFLSRKEAYGLYLKLKPKYTCMIVPAIVTIKR